jgi:hypothetical protein
VKYLPATCSHNDILLGTFFGLEDFGDVPQKRPLISNGLHGIISEETMLSITTL